MKLTFDQMGVPSTLVDGRTYIDAVAFGIAIYLSGQKMMTSLDADSLSHEEKVAMASVAMTFDTILAVLAEGIQDSQFNKLAEEFNKDES